MSGRISDLASRLLRDGRLSTVDAARLIAEAQFRAGAGISSPEKTALRDVYARNVDKFDGGARTLFERVLGRLDPPTARSTLG